MPIIRQLQQIEFMMLSSITFKSLASIVALCVIAITEAISINLISSGIQKINIGLILLFLVSSISHTIVPILINTIASDQFQKRYANIIDLKSIPNYLILERGIQVTEQIYLNLTTANLYIIFRTVQICLITTIILSINTENLFLISFIGIFFLGVNLFIRRFILNSISGRISAKFEFISNIRSSASNYAKGMYFNGRNYDNEIVNASYLDYFRLLAFQNGMSGVSRTCFDILSASLIIFLLTTDNFNLNQIVAYGWAGLRLIPAIQQILFYYNIKRTTQRIYYDTLSLEPKNIKFLTLPNAVNFRGSKCQITGISGSGKSSYLDFYAKQCSSKIGYYTQNFVPVVVSHEEANLIKKYKWAPDVKNGLLKNGEKQYSEGELQRISVAIILSDPQNELLIFDEPFSSQSEGFMKQMQSSIADDKRSCLLVSHVGVMETFTPVNISKLVQ
jgi:ABC-type lipoprotein export system ATPase subunit